MIKINAQQREKLSRYFDDLDSLLENDDIQTFLDRIDDIIVNNIISNNDEPDEEGIDLQRVYDQLYNQNGDE